MFFKDLISELFEKDNQNWQIGQNKIKRKRIKLYVLIKMQKMSHFVAILSPLRDALYDFPFLPVIFEYSK